MSAALPIERQSLAVIAHSTTEADAINELAQWLSVDGIFSPLDANNKRLWTKPLTQADASTECGFIKVRPNILALDLDREDGVKIARQIKRKCPYPVAILESGGSPDRAHVFIRIDNPEEREKFASYCKKKWPSDGEKKAADVKRTIRPPGNPHRTSGARSWSVEGYSIEEIHALLRHQKRPDRPGTSKRHDRPDLEAIAATARPTTTRSEGIYYLACECQRQGQTEADFQALVKENPSGTGAKIAELKSEKAKSRYLDRVWNDARKQVRIKESKTEEWQWEASNHPRVKKSRADLATTIDAIAEMGMKSGKRILSIPERSLAEAAGISRAAARKHLEFLASEGLIHKVSQGRGIQGSIYSLKNSTNKTTLPKGDRGRTRRVVTFVESLVSRPGQRRLWRMLRSDKPQTVAELAEALGRAASGVYRALKSLITLGLAVKSGRGYHRIESEAAHQEAARLRGTAGTAERRRMDHQRHREGWIMEIERRERQAELSQRRRHPRLSRRE